MPCLQPVVIPYSTGRLKLQNADSDTGKKLANNYHASNVKLRPKCDEGPDDTISEEETAELKAVYFTSSKELTQPRCFHKMKGDGNCYFRAISFILTFVEKITWL